jgi:hypothetical protein
MKKPRPAKNRQSGQQVAKMGLGRVELPTSRLSGGHRALTRADQR